MLPAKKHRILNTAILIVILGVLTYGGSLIKDRFDSVSSINIERSEIAQIVIDEGYRSCKYNDTELKSTIGFGHLVKDSDRFGRCISPKEAVELLANDYAIAKESVIRLYPWALGDAQRALINLHYQMGESRVKGFKKALQALENKDYYLAAAEFLDSKWAKQSPRRAQRIAGRIMAIEDSML
tara:strand:+ start:473 stop:1021 length:549 start_codon:yes stop_codon:yes gene_type:complete